MTTYTATYSPDDNKIRLYASTRLDPETYARVKAAGFSWAPRQELFVAPMWTPAREDLALELAGEIDDEDSTLVDRAEARADRFEEYGEKRTADAESARRAVASIADGIPFGQPILVGHHSERHARRDAERIESGMRRAVKMWETADYWTRRAAGALQAAKYKELPAVRARRIKGLEAEARKLEKENTIAEKHNTNWRGVLACADHEKAAQMALHVANYDYVSKCFTVAEYPRVEGASTCEGMTSLYSALTGKICTPQQAAEIALRVHDRTIARNARWLAHIANRLAYERAMLGEAGGLVSDRVAPEKGGAVRCWASPGYGKGWSYIHKVNKVSVTVMDNWGDGGRDLPRNIPFDKLQGVMTAAQVAEAREAGRIMEAGQGRPGFYLTGGPTPEPREPEEMKPEAAAFQAMKETLREGVTVAVVPQLFPTPPDIAARMVEAADIEAGMDVLEPSAGTGNLLRAMPAGVAPFAVEINPHLCEKLSQEFTPEADKAAGLCRNVLEGDFLNLGADQLGQYDRIIMNPPFKNGEDIRHIEHARRFLKPGGRLVALCADGPRQRAALQPLAADWQTLPAGSFAEAGTQVNVAMLTIEAPL